MQCIETYLGILGTLVQPQQLHTELSRQHFQQSLRINLRNVWKKVSGNEAVRASLEGDDLLAVRIDDVVEGDEVLWQYACCCLKLLHLLRDSMVRVASVEVQQQQQQSSGCQHQHHHHHQRSSAPPLPADVLGSLQQNTVLTAVQLVVCLAICPNLLPGVGVPLTLRSGFASLVTGPPLPWIEKRRRLMLCSKVLLRCVDQPNLGSLVLSRCLGDLLAALMQLRYAPVPKADPNTQAADTAAVAGDATERKEVRAFSDAALKKLLGNVYQPMIVKELLLLQSGPPPQMKQKFAPSPSWLRKPCSRGLTNILVGSNKGVQFVLKGMLDQHPDMTQSEWRKCDAAAKVIAHCPLHNQLSPDDYFAKVAPQVIDLLHLSDKVMVRQYERVAISTMNAMYASQPGLTQRYLIAPILNPLMLCLHTPDPGSTSNSDVIVCDKALGQCIADLHVLTRFPSSPLLLCLRPVLHPLYKLYEFTSLSLLNPLAHMILLAFFKSVDVLTAVECLKFLAMGDAVAAPQACHIQEAGPKQAVEEVSSDQATSASAPAAAAQSPSKHQSGQWMSPHLCFVMAPSGGAMIKHKVDKREPENIEATAVKLVTLIKELNRDDVVAEFFLYLLEELGHLLVEETKKTSGIVIPGLPPSCADMARLRHNLLQLMLLATLCDQLPDTCFTNTPHILRFAKITLERAVYVLEKSDDEDMGMFESETITMAMGLLTAVMGGAAPISSTDRLSTQELLPLLEKLSTAHPDPSVQEMATDIRIAIATHGMVLSDLLKAEKARGARKQPTSKPKPEPQKKVLIEELPDLLPPPKSKDTASKEETKRKSSLVDSGLEEPLYSSDDVKAKPRQSSSSADSGLEDNGCAEVVPPLLAPSAVGVISAGRPAHVPGICKTEKKSQQDSPTRCIESNNTPEEQDKKTVAGERGMEATSAESSPPEKQEVGKQAEDVEIKRPESGLAKSQEELSELEQAYDELLDPLVPVRGHALITLRRLLENGDTAALEQHDVLLKIFHENLGHGDSYIYLSAIQGMATLANRRPGAVLPVVVQEYGSTEQQRSPESRLKLGEVMMKTCRAHGELVPQYRDTLLNSILTVLRTDKDNLVRASAVSNLAELCRLLRFSLAGVLWEVVECVSGLLKCDSAVEVRQGAAMLITMLLQGLGQDAFKVLDSALKELYGLLKHVLRVEKEDAVKLHVRLALDELDTIMRTFLFPKQSLQKEINVLNVPDNSMLK